MAICDHKTDLDWQEMQLRLDHLEQLLDILREVRVQMLGWRVDEQCVPNPSEQEAMQRKLVEMQIDITGRLYAMGEIGDAHVQATYDRFENTDAVTMEQD